MASQAVPDIYRKNRKNQTHFHLVKVVPNRRRPSRILTIYENIIYAYVGDFSAHNLDKNGDFKDDELLERPYKRCQQTRPSKTVRIPFVFKNVVALRILFSSFLSLLVFDLHSNH